MRNPSESGRPKNERSERRAREFGGDCTTRTREQQHPPQDERPSSFLIPFQRSRCLSHHSCSVCSLLTSHFTSTPQTVTFPPVAHAGGVTHDVNKIPDAKKLLVLVLNGEVQDDGAGTSEGVDVLALRAVDQCVYVQFKTRVVTMYRYDGVGATAINALLQSCSHGSIQRAVTDWLKIPGLPCTKVQDWNQGPNGKVFDDEVANT